MESPRVDALRRVTLLIWTAIGALLLLFVVVWAAVQVRIIWMPLVFAGGLVLLLNPTVTRLERRRVPRSVGSIFAFLVLAGIITAAGFLLVPLIREQSADFASQLPSLYDGIIAWLTQTGDSLGIDLGPVWTSETIREWIQDPANQQQIQDLLGGFGSGAGRLVRGVVEVVAVMVLAPVLAFYLLLDASRIKERARELTPPGVREEAVYVSGQVARALGGFVRGQLVVAFIVGVASSIGLAAIDLPFWLIIGLISGLLNLVPFIGPFVGGALAALVALLNGNVGQALWAVGIFTVIQQTDNHLITPLVQRTRVRLPPVVIVLSLIVGGAVAGLLGVLVAVPLTAMLRIVGGHLWRTRILGESWAEASEKMIEVTPRPETLVPRRRKPVEQAKLFDTAELPVLEPEGAGKHETD
ncbi:MAG TPA: AI-2E family transporter [Acidimicrobiia bacterium]|nr:AI-2E family transporter [Acidimicrobiia bacterium]